MKSRYTAQYLEGEGEMLQVLGHLLAPLQEVPNMDPSESLANRRRFYQRLAFRAGELASAAAYTALLVDQPKPRRQSAATGEAGMQADETGGGV